MSHLSSLYHLAKTKRRPFPRNDNNSQLALSHLNGSEGISGYKVSNMSSKNKKKNSRFFCWFSFYFTLSEFPCQYIISYIILSQITENILNTLILIFIQKLLGHFAKRWPRMNTQRENCGSSTHLESFHFFGEHDW